MSFLQRDTLRCSGYAPIQGRLTDSKQARAWTWPTEGGETPVPAYMVGYTGIHSFLLRLTHKELPLPLMPVPVHTSVIVASVGPPLP